MAGETGWPLDGQIAVYTVAEAAKVARVGRNQMYDLIATGQVPHRRFGRAIRIPVEPFHRWLNQA